MRPKDLDKEAAIRSVALHIIATEGLEHLSMQKLAKAAGVSPRTIYIKYENKEDLLVKLFIKEVLGTYEQAVLKGFDEEMEFAGGVHKIWTNTFEYLTSNHPHFVLMQYGKSSPLLNKAYQQEHIEQGDFFAPVERFLHRNVKQGIIKDFPHDVLRALLFAPLFDLVSEYFDHAARPKQIITKKLLTACCDVVIKGILK